MKIWHLISNRWNSAISEYALSVAKATRALGHETVVTPLQEGPVAVRFQESNFKVTPVEHFGPAKYGKLATISGNFLPDVIFTYGGPETTAAMFLKGKSKLFRFHGYKSDDGSLLRAVTKRLGHFHVDAVLVPSNYVAAGLRDIFSMAVDVVTLGCDTEIFQLKENDRMPRPELLIFGRLDPVKGHREFFSIFKRLLEISEEKNHPRPKLRIVGLPANLSARHIMEAASVVGVLSDDYEIQCERVANVAEFMSRVSLGVVPSLGSELICRVAEEFLLCGTPVVTTDVGSLPELFVHESFGGCYSQSDEAIDSKQRPNERIEKAADQIYAVLHQSHGENLQARRARSDHARKHFSILNMQQRLNEILARP
jgi:glycosyltransferase involved in cell wall biosynthesis